MDAMVEPWHDGGDWLGREGEGGKTALSKNKNAPGRKPEALVRFI